MMGDSTLNGLPEAGELLSLLSYRDRLSSEELLLECDRLDLGKSNPDVASLLGTGTGVRSPQLRRL